jgi:ubiquinone/menaquinone biosynthesis C-methylase UbiE
VGERIARIAEQTVATADRRHPLAGATVVDLACGTGSAALAATARGATVTGVDLTAELIDLAVAKAGASSITWVTADASDTGLPDHSFDALVSNMGIVFVDPDRQVPELARLLKPAGTLAFSSWRRDADNPFFDPLVDVLGERPAMGFSPDQWGDPAIVEQRLAADFTDVEIDDGTFTWEMPSLDAALHFLEHESPMHVAVFRHADADQRSRLRAAFRAALEPHTTAAGVSFGSSYVVVSARRRA